jgi:protein-S-isoprenylcysteine O-methyltransferase Ste14
VEIPVDSAGVRWPPPAVFAGGLLAGWLLTVWVPTPYLGYFAARTLGGVLIALGALLALSAVYTFRRAGTNLRPDRPSTALVIAGPYRFTRNPMYLSLTIFYLGIAVLLQSLWSVLLLPLVLFVIQTKVIRREEPYLERRFGANYTRYRSQVRRWL